MKEEMISRLALGLLIRAKKLIRSAKAAVLARAAYISLRQDAC
jgi:hypothetical protein